MVLPILSLPLYPDVPDLPGVPPLLRSTLQAVGTTVQLTRDLVSSLSALPTQRWGIFSQFGLPLIFADSFLGIEYSQEYRVSDYPQEKGAFESYNKVQTPFEPRVTFAKGGSEGERALFLQLIKSVIGTTSLYAVVTPEIIYPSVTLTRMDYQRTKSGGATMLTVNIWLRQVRVSGTAAFSSTQSPNGASTVSTGPVQPVVPGVETLNRINSFLSGALR